MPAPLLGIGLGAIAKAAAPAVAGGLIQGAVQRRRDRRAMNNQKELMELQQQNQEKLNAQQMRNQQLLNQQGSDLQMDMWNKTNYEAQIAQMKAAGLNPALMYGMKGGGGTTTGSQSGGSASGGSAAGGNAPAPQQMDLGNIIQAALASAQIEKIKAETENLKATTTKTGAETNTTEFNLKLAEDLRENTILQKQMELSNLTVDTQQKEIYANMKNAVDFVWGEEGTGYAKSGLQSTNLEGRAAKRYIAEFEIVKQTLERAKTENDIAGFKAEVEELNATLAQWGINPTSIAGAKIVTDIIMKVIGTKMIGEALGKQTKTINYNLPPTQ
jgi:hypothetical protein